MLTIAAASALVSAVMSLFTGLLAALVARAIPSWRDGVGRFRWIAVTAGLAEVFNVHITQPGVPVQVHIWCARFQLLFLCLHAAAWLHYLESPTPRGKALDRWAIRAFAAAGLLGLLPGAVYGDNFTHREVRWLGLVYYDVDTTLSGSVFFVLLAAAAVVLVATRRWQSRPVARPGLHRAGSCFLVAIAAHDALVSAGLPLPTPYLLDFGFAPVILLFAGAIAYEGGRDAQAMQALREGLERAVEARTRELSATHEKLRRTERLAALGQFSAAVAHEVNNPAAVIRANLDFLGAEGGLAGEAREVVEESRAALGRISGLTRQLLQAGRTASDGAAALEPVELLAVAGEAARAARARHARADVAVRVEVPAGLAARAEVAGTAQILTNLVVNALQAVPDGRPGTVTVRGEARGDRVALVVEDDGAGMSEDVLQHLFEPFYSTKPRGAGSGLGLAVSRNLALAMEGDLSFESAPGRGTRATLLLHRADGRAGAPGAPAPSADGARTLRVLLADDDDAVRPALVRLLGSRHAVEAVATVDEALAALDRGGHDLVLCDVMMPDGGGERVWDEARARHPEQTRRMIFMTGGAATPEARAFLSRLPQPVLAKPLDVDAFEAVAARLCQA